MSAKLLPFGTNLHDRTDTLDILTSIFHAIVTFSPGRTTKVGGKFDLRKGIKKSIHLYWHCHPMRSTLCYFTPCDHLGKVLAINGLNFKNNFFPCTGTFSIGIYSGQWVVPEQITTETSQKGNVLGRLKLKRRWVNQFSSFSPLCGQCNITLHN